MKKVVVPTKCVFELRGWRETIWPGLPNKKKRISSFRLLATGTAAFVEFDLPRSRRNALRVLDKEYFSSRVMKADNIKYSNRRVGADYWCDVFMGDPKRKKTWRVPKEGEYPGDDDSGKGEELQNFISAKGAIIEVVIVTSNRKKEKFVFPKDNSNSVSTKQEIINSIRNWLAS